MTQAMAPVFPVSLGAGHAPGIAKGADSGEEFSDTFREQIEAESQDSPEEVAATSNAEPVKEQATDDATQVVEEGSANPRVTGTNNEQSQPKVTLQGEAESEVSVEQPLPVGVMPPGAAVEQTALADDMLDPRADVAAHSQGAQLLSRAAGESGTFIVPNRMMRGKAEQAAPVVGQSVAQAAQLDSLAAFAAGKLPQNVARVGELSTPASATALPATALPAVTSALVAAPMTSQGGVHSPASAALALVVDTPLSNPNWGNAMAARLVWGAAQGMQSASIEINPRDLGPVSVNLRVSGDEANITFVSQHALVREAVEAALPRLRELFSGDGINLGEVDISNGQGRSAHGDGETFADDASSAQAADAHADSPQDASSREVRAHRLDSLVDTFV